jgi:cation transport protein ChaC
VQCFHEPHPGLSDTDTDTDTMQAMNDGSGLLVEHGADSVRITRAALAEDAIRARLQQHFGQIPVLSVEERTRNLEQWLAHWNGRDPVHVFAYGSLIWNPAMHCEVRGPGRLFGRHRRMALRSMFGRGTPEFPGLMLTLLPGGCCEGLVLTLDASVVREELGLLWRREMVSGSYRPSRFRVCTAEGPLQCLVFDRNPDHPSFVGPLGFEQELHILSQAVGPLGPNRDYVFQTVEALEAWKLTDVRMMRLARALRKVGPGVRKTTGEHVVPGEREAGLSKP